MKIFTNGVELYDAERYGLEEARELARSAEEFFAEVAKLRGTDIETLEGLHNADIAGFDYRKITHGKILSDSQVKALRDFANGRLVNADGKVAFQPDISNEVAGGAAIVAFTDYMSPRPYDNPETVKEENRKKRQLPETEADAEVLLAEGLDHETEVAKAEAMITSFNTLRQVLGLREDRVTPFHSAGDMTWNSSKNGSAALMNAHLDAILNNIKDPRQITVIKTVFEETRKSLEKRAAEFDMGPIPTEVYDAAMRRINDKMAEYGFPPNYKRGLWAYSLDVGTGIEGTLAEVGIDPETAPKKSLTEMAEELKKASRVKARTGIWRWVKEWFTPTGNMPIEAFRARLGRNHKIQLAIKKAERQGSLMNRHLKKIRGERNRSEAKALINAILHDRNIMRDQAFLSRLDVSGLSDEVVNLAIGMREHMSDMSNQIVTMAKESEFAVLSDAMIAAINNNMDVYVHRSYKAFSDKNWHKKAKRDIGLVTRAAEMFKKIDRGLTDQQALARVYEVLDSTADTNKDFLGVMSTAKINADAIKKRRLNGESLAPLRELLGEYTSPEVNYVKTITQQAKVLQGAKFLADTYAIGMEGGWLFEPTDENIDPKATAKFSAEKNPHYAPLDGVRTYPEILKAFEEDNRA